MRVWFNSRMRPCQGRDNGAIPFTRSIFVGSVAHQQSARVTCERQRGQHSPLPPGLSANRQSPMTNSFALRLLAIEHWSFTQSVPSLWCSPDNMPASHGGNHRCEAGQGSQFPARGSRGIADPPDSESGSLGRARRLAPTSSPSKHCQRCVRSVSESARCNSE